MSEYSIGLDKEEMERLYKYCTSDKDIGSFLFIDMEDRRYRFRKGFYELLQVKDEF
jgi:hypothetical protein